MCGGGDGGGELTSHGREEDGEEHQEAVGAAHDGVWFVVLVLYVQVDVNTTSRVVCSDVELRM